MVSGLLSDEAVHAALDVAGYDADGWAVLDEFDVRCVGEGLLRYHATDGRQALVGEVIDQLRLGIHNEDEWGDVAERIVTALVGEAA